MLPIGLKLFTLWLVLQISYCWAIEDLCGRLGCLTRPTVTNILHAATIWFLVHILTRREGWTRSRSTWCSFFLQVCLWHWLNNIIFYLIIVSSGLNKIYHLLLHQYRHCWYRFLDFLIVFNFLLSRFLSLSRNYVKWLSYQVVKLYLILKTSEQYKKSSLVGCIFNLSFCLRKYLEAFYAVMAMYFVTCLKKHFVGVLLASGCKNLYII